MKKLRYVLFFLAILLIAQRTFIFRNAIAKQKFAAELVRNIAESEAGKAAVDRWVGNLQAGLDDQAASILALLPHNSSAETNVSTSDTYSSPPVYFADISLDDSLRGRIDLHECTPDSYSCESGGIIVLLGSEGEEVFRGSFTVLGEPGSYSLDWCGQPRLSDSEKIEILKVAIGAGTPANADRMRTTLRKIYESESAVNLQETDVTESELWKEVFQAILSQVLADRVKSTVTLSAEG